MFTALHFTGGEADDAKGKRVQANVIADQSSSHTGTRAHAHNNTETTFIMFGWVYRSAVISRIVFFLTSSDHIQFAHATRNTAQPYKSLPNKDVKRKQYSVYH